MSETLLKIEHLTHRFGGLQEQRDGLLGLLEIQLIDLPGVEVTDIVPVFPGFLE